MNLYPLKFVPVYKDYLWGGSSLPQRFGRTAPVGVYAESWEVSVHPDGMSVVANGECKGMTLSELVSAKGHAILGSAVEGDEFPLLIKLIDAARPLSVQVHPDNQHAQQVQGDPKTELWYFLNEESAQVHCGLKPGTHRDTFMAALESQSLEDVLRIVPVEKGRAVFVPGGRVHSIDAGCLILEVQQNSNTTYRVYDWARVDADGQPRELHKDKALQVIDFADEADPVCVPTQLSDDIRTICTCPYFVLDELTLHAPIALMADGQSFHVLFSEEGSFEIEYDAGQIEPVAVGTSVLIPAELGEYEIRPSVAGMIVLRTRVPGSAVGARC
jgi:mannose-6-phosphate isomerase